MAITDHWSICSFCLFFVYLDIFGECTTSTSFSMSTCILLQRKCWNTELCTMGFDFGRGWGWGVCHIFLWDSCLLPGHLYTYVFRKKTFYVLMITRSKTMCDEKNHKDSQSGELLESLHLTADCEKRGHSWSWVYRWQLSAFWSPLGWAFNSNHYK